MNAIGRGRSVSDPVRRSRVASERSTSCSARGCQIGRSPSASSSVEATVKVHVHHVFDKLGVRSRTALAINAARDRVRQAASTILGGTLQGRYGIGASNCASIVDRVRSPPAWLFGTPRSHLRECASKAATADVSNWLSTAWAKSESGNPARHRVAVRSVRGHRVVGIGDRDDLGELRNIIAPELSGYPSPSIRSWWWRTTSATSTYRSTVPRCSRRSRNGPALSPLIESQRPVSSTTGSRAGRPSRCRAPSHRGTSAPEFRRQAHSLGDVPGVDGDCLRVTSRVMVALLESRNKSFRELR